MDFETESCPAAFGIFCMMDKDVIVVGEGRDVWEEQLRKYLHACCGGARELELVDGIGGDGIGTVLLSFTATAKVNQAVWPDGSS